MIVLAVLLDIEIHRAVRLISQAAVDELLRDFDLLNYMPRCRWFNTGRKNIELAHYLVKVFAVALYNLHWFQLFEASFLGDLVFAFIVIAFEVADVGYVPHVTNLITQDRKSVV